MGVKFNFKIRICMEEPLVAQWLLLFASPCGVRRIES
jgi:hypothetical protein